MATLPIPEELWTVREYLRTSWSPDREFVDGRIEERNLGEKEHSILQTYLNSLSLHIEEHRLGNKGFCRVADPQTRNTRFRVPDVLVVRAGEKFERYVTQPPLIAIEILSPEDRLTAMQEKAAEYRLFESTSISGSLIRNSVWPTPPPTPGSKKVHGDELAIPGTPIRVVLSEMFAELDEQ